MKVIESLDALRVWRQSCYQDNKSVAFVPTMGNLHEGHIELVRRARSQADCVITSIFVNPMQFGEGEDLDAYPRTFDADCEKLTAAGNDIVFFPSVKDMYPNGLSAQTVVSVPTSNAEHCAEATQRPGHFDGVATVVTKLFNMVQPDVAMFGEKDYQQVRLVKSLVADLNMPIEIVPVPTVREPNGLAKSSRNGYLTAEQKNIAAAIYQTMSLIKEQLVAGNRQTEAMINSGKELLEQAGLNPDYIEIRDANDLAPLSIDSDSANPTNEVVILIAAYLGKARLIDNMTVRLP